MPQATLQPQAKGSTRRGQGQQEGLQHLERRGRASNCCSAATAAHLQQAQNESFQECRQASDETIMSQCGARDNLPCMAGLHWPS